MLLKRLRHRLSYDDYYEKKYHKGKRKYTILLLILLLLSVSIIMYGIRFNNERQALLEKETTEYTPPLPPE